jgi:hypothetical protein
LSNLWGAGQMVSYEDFFMHECLEAMYIQFMQYCSIMVRS